MKKKIEKSTLKFALVCVSSVSVFILIYLLVKRQKNPKMQNIKDWGKITLNSYNGVYDDNNSLAAINHNPTNIEKSNNKWEGKTETPEIIIKTGRKTRFEAFKNDYYGLRAAMVNLKNGYFAKGYNTINKIVKKWAPPKENSTNSYINYVSKVVGVDKDKILLYSDKNTLFLLIKALAKRDGGFNGDDLIKKVIADSM